jgi:hypothetical protein
MKKYKDWLKEETETSPPAQVMAATPSTTASAVPNTAPNVAPSTANSVAQKVAYDLNKKQLKKKAWKASKDEIMTFWKSLALDIPIQIHPITYDHKGTTIQEDGIRITGTKEFIASVLSKLKDLVNYENDQNKLIISYRQSPKSLVPGNKESYMFYLQVKSRGKD